MPLPKGTRYRIRTYPSGKRVRLAIIGNRVIETKSIGKSKLTKTKRHLQKRINKMHR